MLKQKLQYFGHLMQRTISLEKSWFCEILKAGGEGDDRRWDGWMASPTQWTWVWVNSRSRWWTKEGHRNVVFSGKIFSEVRWTVQFSSIAQSCLTLCNPMNRSTPSQTVHHQLPEFTQTHVHWVGDAIQQSHPLLSSSPPALNLLQHQGLFKWVSS